MSCSFSMEVNSNQFFICGVRPSSSHSSHKCQSHLIRRRSPPSIFPHPLPPKKRQQNLCRKRKLFFLEPTRCSMTDSSFQATSTEPDLAQNGQNGKNGGQNELNGLGSGVLYSENGSSGIGCGEQNLQDVQHNVLDVRNVQHNVLGGQDVQDGVLDVQDVQDNVLDVQDGQDAVQDLQDLQNDVRDVQSPIILAASDLVQTGLFDQKNGHSFTGQDHSNSIVVNGQTGGSISNTSGDESDGDCSSDDSVSLTGDDSLSLTGDASGSLTGGDSGIGGGGGELNRIGSNGINTMGLDSLSVAEEVSHTLNADLVSPLISASFDTAAGIATDLDSKTHSSNNFTTGGVTDIAGMTDTSELTETGVDLLVKEEEEEGGSHNGLWALFLCGTSYLHHSATGFALPALLPLIAADLSLSDGQAATLTLGYTVLYALALIPIGFLADQINRPKLLAFGAILWSGLTSMVSGSGSFNDLLMLRVGFAAAQASQNPICMSMLPELFPKNKSTAMALYNCAIYMGRALSFGFVMILAKLGVHEISGVTMIPLDNLDLDSMSLLYTTGDMAAVVPVYDYNVQLIFSQANEASWRDLLFWLGLPGLVIALGILFTVDDPRDAENGLDQEGISVTSARKSEIGESVMTSARKSEIGESVMTSARKSEFGESVTRVEKSESGESVSVVMGDGSLAAVVESNAENGFFEDVQELVNSPGFRATTFAAAMNDVGGWALISWQAIFFERVFDLPPETYAPILAGIIPLGGIMGGVGGGFIADWLSKSGNRYLLTCGASLLAGPFIYWSLQAETHEQSFWYLLFGFALSECWRAPAAVMVREVAPPSLGSTASALHLCVRNLVGGLGPVAVAILSKYLGLKDAMSVVPASYIVSGVGFLWAEIAINNELKKKRKMKGV